jgi:hypothetical protein
MAAGPSTAVLLTPHVQEWTAGGSEYYLPGLPAINLPDVLTTTLNATSSMCGFPNPPQLPNCPSSGYEGIRLWV